jgi:hypothetical protein
MSGRGEAVMPLEFAYIADKLAGGLVSYAVRSAGDAVLEQFKDRKREEALRHCIRRALEKFRLDYPNLAESLFDETFLATRGMDELSKLLTLSVREVPSANSLAHAFSEYFTVPVPKLEEACAQFLLTFRREIESEPEFSEIITDRLVRDTSGRTTAIHTIVVELLEKVKTLQTQLVERQQPVFEARVEGIVNNSICDEDQLWINNVGAPISQVGVQLLFLFKARMYDMRSKSKVVIIRTNGYYPANSLSGRAQGRLYSTFTTKHRIAVIRLSELARKTDFSGHMALVDFLRLVTISYRDAANKPQKMHIEVSETGYKEISQNDFDELRAAAAQNEIFNFDTIAVGGDDRFIETLRRGLARISQTTFARRYLRSRFVF